MNKNVEPVLLPVPRPEGSRIALFVETSNDESPTQNEYRNSLHATDADRYTAIRIHCGLSINNLRDVLVALFLTNSFGICEILKPSKPRRRKTPMSIMSSPSHPLHPKAKHLRGNSCKITNFLLQSRAF